MTRSLLGSCPERWWVGRVPKINIFPRKKKPERAPSELQSSWRVGKHLLQLYSNKSNHWKSGPGDQGGFTQGFLVKSLLIPTCWFHQRFWVSVTPCCVDQSHHSNQGPPWKADGRPQNGRRQKGCAYRVQKVLRKNTFQHVQVVRCFPNCSTQSFTRSETGNSKYDTFQCIFIHPFPHIQSLFSPRTNSGSII